jgi:hypothetical protein
MMNKDGYSSFIACLTISKFILLKPETYSHILFFCLTGIYFGKPRGFGTNDKGEEIGFNTELYSVSEVAPLSLDI